MNDEIPPQPDPAEAPPPAAPSAKPARTVSYRPAEGDGIPADELDDQGCVTAVVVGTLEQNHLDLNVQFKDGRRRFVSTASRGTGPGQWSEPSGA